MDGNKAAAARKKIENPEKSILKIQKTFAGKGHEAKK